MMLIVVLMLNLLILVSGQGCIEGSFQADQNDCTRYLECLRDGNVNSLLSRPCPPGTGFLTSESNCTYLRDLPNCNPGNAPCNTTELQSDPSNCQRYLECVNGQFITRPCPQGTGFDVSFRICDFLQNLPNCPEISI